MSERDVIDLLTTLSDWARWGADDERDTLNLITPETLLRCPTSATVVRCPGRRVARQALLPVLLGMVALLGGCTMTPIPPTYTPEELAWKCTRTGGWWRPDIAGGYCEYQAPGLPWPLLR